MSPPIPPLAAASGFQSSFSGALRSYKKRTREDLLLHPLAAKLQSCNSPRAALSVLQEQSPSGEESLTEWLGSTIHVLYSLSSSLGEGVGLVLSPAKVIFVGIGVLFSVTRAVHSGQDAFIEIFKRMEQLFKRLEVYEVPSTNPAKDITERIMLAVFSIITTVTEDIKQGRTKKYIKKLTGRGGVEDALQRLDKLTQEEVKLARVLNIAIDEGGSNRLPTTSTLANRDSNSLSRLQLLENVRRWLSPPDPSTNYSAACQARHKGTCEWFLQGSIFKQWKDAGSFLWIHGKPGSGKSTLCSAIIDNIEDMCKAESASMAYFIFDFKDNHKQSRLDMISSLLTQLSTRSKRCLDILSRVYSRHSRGTQAPTGGVLTECLKEMLSLPDQGPIYIIMDALDECPDTPGVPSPREEVLELVEELALLRLSNLRLFVTSRAEIGIRAVLRPLVSFRVVLHDERGQQQDIADYLKAVVQSDRNIRRWRKDDKDRVIDALSKGANGMFRWVACQLEILRHCLPPSVNRILAELPASLDETYERILMEINTANKKHAHRLLQCLTAAIRPLHVEELAEVLAVDIDAEGAVPKLNEGLRWKDQKGAVLSACSSLVAVVNVDGSDVVQFSHPSVKEFLTSPRLAASSERVSFFHVSLEPAHTILAQACLGVLLRLDDQINRDSIKEYPLAEYAARYWVEHANHGNVSSHLEVAMETLFDPEKRHFDAWVWMHDMDESPDPPAEHPTRPQAGPLYYSILCGFHRLAEHLIVDRHVDVNARGGRFGTPLQAALYKGHTSIALLLIGHDAEVNSLDDEDLTPLRMALDDRNFDVVQLLLARGANTNIQANKRSTPLHIASGSDHTDAIRSILEHNAEIDARDGRDRTPLHVASDNGDSGAVQVLLEHCAGVTFHDNKGLTPLHLVSVKGKLELAISLVRYGADIDAQDNRDSTPLHLALVNGNLKVAGFLVQCGANVKAKDNKASTPLHIASLNGNIDIAGLLIRRGADVNARDSKHWTPLHLASDSGSAEVVKVLMKNSANANLRDLNHVTPLHVASRRRHVDVVEQLLQGSVALNVQNKKGWTPLHIATQERAVEIVRSLLKRGADPNLGDGDRRTPLHVASSNKNGEIVQLLIKHGADPCALDNNNQVPYRLRSTPREEGNVGKSQ